MTNRCFACDRPLGSNPYPADTRDSQFVLVGSECYKLIKAAGETGYQPPKGGPRLWCILSGLTQEELSRINRAARGITADQERIARLEAKASMWTARAREYEEQGRKAAAERAFEKAEHWLTKANAARGW